jgi:hypothetical protein
MILFFLFHHMKKNDSYMLKHFKHFVHKFCKFFKTDQEYIDDPVIGWQIWKQNTFDKRLPEFFLVGIHYFLFFLFSGIPNDTWDNKV